MVLSDQAQSGLEVHGAWIDGYDSQNKDKKITITKIKSLLFFHAVYYSKSHVIPQSPPCNCCHLERHLKYISTLKGNNNMPVKFSKYNRKLSDIVTNCEFDFRLNFALNGGHIGHHRYYFNLVNQTCECFILIVCIVRPLNIDKNKIKMLYRVFSELGLRNLTYGRLGRHLKISTF